MKNLLQSSRMLNPGIDDETETEHILEHSLSKNFNFTYSETEGRDNPILSTLHFHREALLYSETKIYLFPKQKKTEHNLKKEEKQFKTVGMVQIQLILDFL